MPAITTEAERKIIDDFVKIIQEKKLPKVAKPAKVVINYKDEIRRGDEREVELVPVSVLRYRKENGRISSDVANYQKSNGPLDDTDQKAQELLGKFLEDKDPELTDDLMKSIEHIGQSEPAIITCDGFLINGNRRKMALEKLKKLHPGKSEYESMKVVILPGRGDPGGPPTILDIEQLENRYQLQRDGKSEYYGFDQALSIKRKKDLGFTLEMQLRDDPRYVRAGQKEIAQAVKEMEQEYLRPLECVDNYLRMFGREGLYGTVSEGRGDREGRWEAFKDYAKTYNRCFQNPKWMMEKGVDEEDIGSLEEAIFKIIKLRHLRGLPKVHMVMRQLPKLCGLKESRKELLKISDEVELKLPEKECFDAQGNRLSIEKVDEKWNERSQTSIIHHLKKALEHQERNQEKETPISLLKAALQKLNHESMNIASIGLSDFPEARELASNIQKRAHDIEQEIYRSKKEFESLARKK
jgi:hypothetical protein